jgi:hypothetical protein
MDVQPGFQVVQFYIRSGHRSIKGVADPVLGAENSNIHRFYLPGPTALKACLRTLF